MQMAGSLPQLSDEQRAVTSHDIEEHGRVLAGPGTGKSLTAVAMLRLLMEEQPDVNVRMVTFTRAATQELAEKFERHGVQVPPPSTIHSLALSLLLRHPNLARLPLPLRIPDHYETDNIQKDLARRLREADFEYLGRRLLPSHVKKLEREMAARWEALDEDLTLLTEIQPELRGAYTTLWERHRSVLGYTLLAEIPYRSGRLLEDHHPNLGGLEFLLVDEYQDLNRADIRFLEQLAERGVRILAIGDDEQSVYSFRMAAPEGIRQFLEEFGTEYSYNLTRCYRCGGEILTAATALMEGSPDRAGRPSLTAATDHAGSYLYARFPSHRAEAEGVADMIQARREQGIPAGDIVVLVRSSVGDWVAELGPRLEERNIDYVDPDQVTRTLSRVPFRQSLETLQIASQPEDRDSLAWWILLDIIRGISGEFREYVFDQALEANEPFADALFRLYPGFEESPTTQSANRTRELVDRVRSEAAEIRTEAQDPDLGEAGWGAWILDRLGREAFQEDEIELLQEVGEFLSETEDLGSFLGQLEPVAKDLATGADAVRIMSMTKSKGLTVNSAFIMGVEEDQIPREGVRDPEEERRLLYVAMTRPTHLCVLSYANRRTGRTARHGGGSSRQSRGRSPLLEHLPIGEWLPGEEVIRVVSEGV